MTDTPLSLAAVLQDIHTKAEIRYPVALDPEIRERLTEAHATVEQAQSDYKQALKRAALAREDAYMSETVADPSTKAVEDAQEHVRALQEQAADSSVIIVFSGWLGRKYDEVVQANLEAAQEAAKNKKVRAQIAEVNSWIEAAFLRAETPDGKPYEATVEDVLDIMLAGDRNEAAKRILAASERPSGLPF